MNIFQTVIITIKQHSRQYLVLSVYLLTCLWKVTGEQEEQYLSKQFDHYIVLSDSE